MNGSMVNDRQIKGGQTISLQNGDIITFGQYPQQFMFQYEGSQKETYIQPLKDEKISLVNKAKPTFARIDHLATPIPPGKTPMTVFYLYFYIY